MPSVAASFDLQYDPRALPTTVWGATAMADGMYCAAEGDVAGRESAGSDGDARLYRSTDGLNWRETTHPPTKGRAVALCCSGNGAVVYLVTTETGGAICKTSDSGATWTRITNPSAGSINQVFCASNGTDVWIVTSNSELWRSANGGSSWTKELTAAGQLFSVWGVSAGNALWAGGAGGILYHSNGGGTWSSQTSGVSDAIKAIFGVSSTEIYAHTGASHATANTLIRSTNGTTWSTITPAGTWQAWQGLWAVAGHLYVSGCNTGSGSGKAEILHSTNQGIAFSTEFSLAQQGDHATGQNVGRIWGYSGGTAEVFCFAGFSAFFDISATTVAIVGSDGTRVVDQHLCLRSTLTAGAWKVWIGNFMLTSIWAASSSAIWVGGQFGALYKWNGSTWTPMPMALDANCRHITALYGFSPTDIYVADSYSQTRDMENIDQTSVFPSRILHSTDGGVSWSSQYTANYTINDLWGPDATHVYAARGNRATLYPYEEIAGSGALLKTNGGGTWSAVTGGGPGFGRQAFVSGSSATDVWSGGGGSDMSGVHAGDPSGTLAFAGSSGGGEWLFVPTAGLSLGAGDMLLGPASGGGLVVSYLLRTAADGAGWRPEVFPRSHMDIVSLAKVSPTHLYALSGRKLFFPQREADNGGTLYYSAGDRVWRDVQLPHLHGRSPSRMLAIDASHVYVVGGRCQAFFVSGGGASIVKLSGPPAFAALTPAADTNVAYRKWTPAAQMAQTRVYPGAIVLTTGARAGQLMVCGGFDFNNFSTFYLSTEFYDRGTDTWSAGPDMPDPLAYVKVCTLADGRVLAIDAVGDGDTRATSAVNIYDPVANTWSAAAPTPERLQFLCNPFVLNSGDVLVVGARGAAIYSPGSDTWRRITPHPGQLVEGLTDFVARFTGGAHAGGIAVVAATWGITAAGFYLFDEATETWATLAPPIVLTNGYDGGGMSSLVALPGGRMLATSFPDLGDPAIYGAAQVYDSASDTWTDIGRTFNSAAGIDAVVLNEGVVLQQYSDADRTGTRIFDPASFTFRKLSHSPTADLVSGATSFAGEVGCAMARFPDGVVWLGAGADYAQINIPDDPYFGCALLAPDTEPGHNAAWSGIAEMWTSRAFYGSEGVVVLPDGSVLVAGGYTETGEATTSLVEKFSPTSNHWTPMAPMLDQRGGHGLVVLPSGKVLATGGFNAAAQAPSGDFILARCEVYDAGANTWTRAASLATPRKRHRSAVLTAGPNAGKVIVVGGQDAATDFGSAFDTVNEVFWFFGTHTATCEIYNPAGDTWASTGSLNTARSRHALVALPDGDILVIGGFNGDSDSGIVALDTIERYSAAAGTWSVVATMSTARERPAAVLRDDGKVVIWGGWATEPITIFDPTTNVLIDVTGPGVNLLECAIIVEENGKVAICGGFDPTAYGFDYTSSPPDYGFVDSLPPSYSYDPKSSVFVLKADDTLDDGPPMLTRRAGHVLVELSDSRILAIGGGGVGESDSLRESASVETIGCECGSGGGGGGVTPSPPSGSGVSSPDGGGAGSELGVDIDGVFDVGRSLSLAFAIKNLGNALCRRLITPRGSLFYDPNYGIDVRDYLKAGFTPSRLASLRSEITAEVLKDERVQSADVSVAVNQQAATMTITIVVDIASGPFELMIGVDSLTVELLSAKALS